MKWLIEKEWFKKIALPAIHAAFYEYVKTLIEGGTSDPLNLGDVLDKIVDERVKIALGQGGNHG